MKMHEPIGSPIYGPLLLRVTLGIYFFLAGEAKLNLGPQFMAEVKSFGLLPDRLAELYAVLLPWLEIFAGILLVLGLWTTLAAILTSLMLLSFVIAMGPFGHRPFNKDIILLASSLSLLFHGAGALSVDRFRKSG